MMNEKELIEIAEGIEKYISDKLIKAYFESFSENSDEKIIGIIPYLKRLANRSREYNNQSFVVLVVGPVKSGKSTFVNLVANEYVSPTHFLECTGRPSIISKGDSREITIYRSKDTQNKAGQIEDIFDSLNGLIQKDEIANVDTQTVELNKENIESYVKLDLNNDDIDETLITSITTNTDAGGLLQDNVLLVDMAGFDGAKVNMDNTPYEKIVERADVIIFVQSSNSAISKVATEFFDIIKKHNTKAPICLIHNIFDSAYWRPDDLKKTNADEHIQYAVNQFRSIHHLPIDESRAFNVNLGKVSDLRSENYQKDYLNALEEAQSEFKEVEQKIAHFFTSRGIIRMENCIERTRNKSVELFNYIEDIKEIYDCTLERYNSLLQKFEKRKVKEGDIICDCNIKYDPLVLMKLLRGQYAISKKTIKNAGGPFLEGNAKNIIDTFLSNVKSAFEEYLNNQISEKKWQQCIMDIISKINCFLTEEGADSKVYCNIEVPKIVIDFNIGIQSTSLFDDFLPYYTENRVLKELQFVVEMLEGKDNPKTPSDNYPSLIDTKLYPEMQKKILKAKDDYIKASVSAINNEMEWIKKNVLEKIISDTTTFTHNYRLVENFEAEIKPLKEKSYE